MVRAETHPVVFAPLAQLMAVTFGPAPDTPTGWVRRLRVQKVRGQDRWRPLSQEVMVARPGRPSAGQRATDE